MAGVRDIAIVGGGLAAAKAAEAARNHDFGGHITLFSDEPIRPYERPPLSKGFLLGGTYEEEIHVHDADFYDHQNIDVRLDEGVTAIDRNAGEVITSTGRRERFDRLLLATGAEPRRLPTSSPSIEGVHTLRDLPDSRRLRGALERSSHVTVIGAGWIGCEVASAARTLGVDVTMVDPLAVPLRRVLGLAVGRIFADLHRDQGVDLRLGTGVTGLLGNTAVEAVGLTDGTRIDTELVVVGIGAVPRTELAERAGLDTDDGVLVDATLTSSDPRILAAGDVARATHPWLDGPLRVEHWANALNQGTTAGRNLVGGNENYDRVPYFYSDQYDLGMEYSGHTDDPARVVFRGDVAAREFIAFWLDDADRVLAGMNCNVWDVTPDIQRLIRSRRPVDPTVLMDPGEPLVDVPVAG